MSRRDEWRKVLDIELAKWSAKSCEELVAEFGDHDNVAYEVEIESKRYQVEADILENTDSYVLVSVAVDDGSLPASIVPASRSFRCEKPRAV